MKEREFFRERHAGFFAEAQRHTQKFGQQNAHFSGFRRVHTCERADGIEAVEKKMRIYLRLEGSQFGVAGKNAGFERARFSLARFLDGENYVMRGDGEQIEQEADAEEYGNLRRKAFTQSAKGSSLRKDVGQQPCKFDPEKADDDGGDQVRKSVANERGSAKGRGFTHVPGGKTDKLIDEAKRENQDGGVQPAEVAGDGQQVDENARERSPGQQVVPITIDRCEERMH